jgi:predicted NBD/HSP70 family sugar kinase
MVYIGVDLHRNKSQITAIDQEGNLVLNRKVRTGPAEMQQLIDELRPQLIEVASRRPSAGAGSPIYLLSSTFRLTWRMTWRPRPSPGRG